MALIEYYEQSLLKQYFPVIATFFLLISIAIYHIVMIGNPTEYKIKEGFQGTIVSKFKYKNYVYVGLTNKEKKQEIMNGYNYSYNRPELINFIEVGDEILKNECSDTVYVRRNNNEFHFIQLAYGYNDPSKSKSKKYKEKWMSKRIIRLYEEGCLVDSNALNFALDLIKLQGE